MSRHLIVKFTEKELASVMECLETMMGMVGAMDEEFNKEQELGFKNMNKALKRSGLVYNRPDYKTNFNI